MKETTNDVGTAIGTHSIRTTASILPSMALHPGTDNPPTLWYHSALSKPPNNVVQADIIVHHSNYTINPWMTHCRTWHLHIYKAVDSTTRSNAICWPYFPFSTIPPEIRQWPKTLLDTPLALSYSLDIVYRLCTSIYQSHARSTVSYRSYYFELMPY